MIQAHQQPVDKQLLLRCIVLIIIFTAVILYIAPPITFIDDTFSQYILGGGFPAAVTKVTYFEYSFLFYESFFAWMYRCFPAINVMTVFYLLLHGICAVVISYTLFRYLKGPALIVLPGYLLLFLAPFLIHLSYTSVAGHCIATVLFLCAIRIMQQKVPGWKESLLLLLLMLLGAGLRVHILLPLFACALPLAGLLRHKAMQKRFMLLLLLLGSSLTVFILLHQHNYKQKIAGWQNIRATMDAAFYLSNHGDPDITTDTIKDKNLAGQLTLIKNAVFNYDGSLYNDSLISRYQQQATYNRRSRGEGMRHVYQVFTKIRKPLFFLCLSTLLLVIAPVNNKQKVMVLAAGTISICTLLYMAYYLKAPERVSLPVILVAFLLCCAALLSGRYTFPGRYKVPAVAISLALIVVQSISFYNLRKDNLALITRFVRNVDFLQQHKETLFIELAPGGFALDGFPALLPPGRYPLENICLDFFFNTELRHNTLRHFGFRDVQEAILRGDNIMTVGKINPELVQYIYKKENIPVEFRKLKDAPEDLLLTTPQLAIPVFNRPMSLLRSRNFSVDKQ